MAGRWKESTNARKSATSLCYGPFAVGLGFHDRGGSLLGSGGIQQAGGWLYTCPTDFLELFFLLECLFPGAKMATSLDSL
jgi:hypothetical protein